VSETSDTGELSELREPGSLLESTIAGKYVVQRLLGVGGMGEVYLALQQPLGREVAVKVLRPPRDSGVDREQFEKMFLEEAGAAAGLKSPHTVTVFDYGRTEDGIPYLVMDYLEGQTVDELLEDGDPLPLSRAVHIGIQVCRSLREAHEQGIVHRDLKPANVILSDRDNDPYFASVLDFGLTGALFDAPAGDDVVRFMGSPRYAAPEQFRPGEVPDHRADIYSFGLFLYAMVAAHSPYTGDTGEQIHGHLEEPPPAFESWDRTVPEVLEALIRRCLEKAPGDRFQSMTDVIRGLSEVDLPDDEVEPDITAHDLADFARELELDDDSSEAVVAPPPPPAVSPEDRTVVSTREPEVDWPQKRGGRTGLLIAVVAVGALALLVFVVVVLGTAGMVSVPWLAGPQDGPPVTVPAAVDEHIPAAPPQAIIEDETPPPEPVEPVLSDPDPSAPPPPRPTPDEPPPSVAPVQTVETTEEAALTEPPPAETVTPAEEPTPAADEAQLDGYKEDPY